MVAALIKTEEEYQAALARIDDLMSAQPGTPKFDELELWVLLVENYDDRHRPIAPPDPLETIRFFMDQQGLRQVDLVPYLGSKSKVSEVLSGKRALSLSMIRNLHEGLGIPPDMLILETKKARAKDRGKTAEQKIGTINSSRAQAK